MRAFSRIDANSNSRMYLCAYGDCVGISGGSDVSGSLQYPKPESHTFHW